MAPRQRIATGVTQEEIPAAPTSGSSTASSSSDLSTSSESKKPLVLDDSLDDIARERHDIFNIVALLFVVAATVINWDILKLPQGIDAAWTGEYFYWNWATTVLYFLVDLIWVANTPECVKSPSTIIKHHTIAIAYLSAPVFWPEYRWFMGACLSVEINTWFLILRRVLYKRSSNDILRKFVGCCFYTSWIIIRVIVYPAIFVVFCLMAQERIHETSRLWHWPMMFMPIHFFLCILNLKWSSRFVPTNADKNFQNR